MPAAAIRDDLSPQDLRALARRERDGRVCARLHGLAHAREGKSRAEAARLAGIAGRAPISQINSRRACAESPRSPTIQAGASGNSLIRPGASGASCAWPGARAKATARPWPSAITQAFVPKPPRERPSASR